MLANINMPDAVSIGAIIISSASAIGAVFTAIHFKLNSNCCSCCSCEAWQNSPANSRNSTIKKYENKETAIYIDQPKQDQSLA
jgi:hypothetical protein